MNETVNSQRAQKEQTNYLHVSCELRHGQSSSATSTFSQWEWRVRHTSAHLMLFWLELRTSFSQSMLSFRWLLSKRTDLCRSVGCLKPQSKRTSMKSSLAVVDHQSLSFWCSHRDLAQQGTIVWSLWFGVSYLRICCKILWSNLASERGQNEAVVGLVFSVSKMNVHLGVVHAMFSR